MSPGYFDPLVATHAVGRNGAIFRMADAGVTMLRPSTQYIYPANSISHEANNDGPNAPPGWANQVSPIGRFMTYNPNLVAPLTFPAYAKAIMVSIRIALVASAVSPNFIECQVWNNTLDDSADSAFCRCELPTNSANSNQAYVVQLVEWNISNPLLRIYCRWANLAAPPNSTFTVAIVGYSV